jgi:hypothetical protein
MTSKTESKADRIRSLNDAFRRTFVGGARHDHAGRRSLSHATLGPIPTGVPMRNLGPSDKEKAPGQRWTTVDRKTSFR